jgi:hypothetical protein
MSHQQRVLNMLAKLSKTPAQARKVQFSLSEEAAEPIADLASLSREVDQLAPKIDEVIASARRVYSEIEVLQGFIQISYDIAIRIKGNIEEAADNLGIDPSLISNYDQLSEAISKAEIVAEDLTAYSQDDIFGAL